MPRPDLAALGVQYRRIPVLSIGKDVYYGDGKALENLLESWSTDGGLFLNAVLLMPLGLPTLRDPAFLKDRASFFTGLSWKVEDMPSLRGEALVQVKRAFGFLESTLLADGREWLRKTEKPTLADIHAIWPLNWVFDMGSLDGSIISDTSHPKVFAWRTRFRQALSNAEAKMGEMLVSGNDVLDGL
ncbi:hypothetical protein McaMca56_000554 [Microsporum canis]